MANPVYNPVLPYHGLLDGGLPPGRLVRIQGRTNLSTKTFIINLFCGPNSSDEIALHLSIRFAENAIVRNSRSFSGWGSEERHGPPFPLFREQNFEVLILCETSDYKIAINGEHYAEFNHRLSSQNVTHVGVEGDVAVTLIQWDGPHNVNPTAGYSPSAPIIPSSVTNVTSPPPYPTGDTGGLPPMGFAAPIPPASPNYNPGSPYPPGPGSMPSSGGYPPGPMPYAGQALVPAAGGYHQYPPSGGAYPPPAGYPPPGAYPTQPGIPPQQGYYPDQTQGQHGAKGGGMMDNAGKALAGGLAAVGLGKVANKIPGMGHSSHPSYPHPGGHGHSKSSGGGMGMLGPALGGAAALGATGLAANHVLKGKGKKNKLLKYGLPIAGAGVGAYALKKGMKGFKGKGRGGSSSSSSSSSSEEE